MKKTKKKTKETKTAKTKTYHQPIEACNRFSLSIKQA